MALSIDPMAGALVPYSQLSAIRVAESGVYVITLHGPDDSKVWRVKSSFPKALEAVKGFANAKRLFIRGKGNLSHNKLIFTCLAANGMVLPYEFEIKRFVIDG